MGYIGVISDNGKANGNYYDRLDRVCIGLIFYIGIMEKKN